MPFINVQCHNLLKKLIQRLIRVCHNQSTLIGLIVVDVRNYLHGNICFARTRRTHHQSKARLHSRSYGFNLRGRKANAISKIRSGNIN